MQTLSAPRGSTRTVGALALMVLALADPAQAATAYWDSNGTTPGAGATPTGTWDTDAFWSTSSVGTAAPTAYTSASDVVFSAGADAVNPFTVTLTTTQNAASLTFKEGTPIISGTGGIITLSDTGGNVSANGAVNATIGNNTTTIIGGTVGLTKTGGGTLTLSGSAVNTFTGGLNLNGGTLALNFANLVTPTDLINLGNALTFSGGAMTIKAKTGSGVTTSQTFNGVTVNAGGGSLLVDPLIAGNTTNVTLGSLGTLSSWAAGCSLLLGNATANGGTLNMTFTSAADPLSNGILSGRVVYTNKANGMQLDTEFATAAETSPGSGEYTLKKCTPTSLTLTGGSDLNNSFLQDQFVALSGSRITNSLRIIQGNPSNNTLDIGNRLLTLASGGLLCVSLDASYLTGAPGGTRLTAGTGSQYELIVHQYDTYNSGPLGGLNISAVIGDNVVSGTHPVTLTKAGTKKLVLTGTNTYSGDTYITAGTLALVSGVSSSTSATTGASTTINVGSTTGWVVGQAVYGTRLAANSYITRVINDTSIKVNATPVSSGADTLSTTASTGSIDNSPNIDVALGATFDVSRVSGGYALGSSINQTLKGTGTVAGTVSVANRGILSPGNSVGTLTFSAPNTALTLDGSAAYNFEIAGTTASPISDLINLTGATSTVSFAGDWTLNVSNLGTVDPTGLTFVLFDYTASGDPSLGMPTINYGAGAARWSGGTVSVDSANTRVVLSGITLGPPPIISATAALTAFTTIYGTPSTAQSFTVSGTDMIAGILVSPPPGFEVSLSIGSGYAGTITVGAAGSIAETPVYVRLSATAPIGTYNSKNIVLSSSEAANVNVTTSASDNEVTRTAFDLWALINCPAGQRLMTDDPDGDNQNNLTEFALGGTPNNGALNAKVYSFIAESSFYNPPQGKELVLTIAVLKGTPAFSTAASPVAVNTTAGVTYTIQSSTTMSFPDASTAFPVTKIDTGLPLLDPAKHEYRSFVLMNSNGLPAKGFLRVKVEPNP